VIGNRILYRRQPPPTNLQLKLGHPLIIDLGVISQNAEALAPKARMALSECVSLAKQSLRELRTLSYQLHPPMFDELGLSPALRIYIEGFSQRSGMKVETELPDSHPQLPQELAMAVFHVVQEGLTNAQRHSASPWAKISLSVSPTGIWVSVENVASGASQLNNDAVELAKHGGVPAGAGAAFWRSSFLPLGTEPHRP
jgi:signal transduction histidine kinase